MKNMLFWGGLFLATFWDEMLLMATEPKKTKRQQQFLETGETAQYFIGALDEPYIIIVLGKIFTKKKYTGRSISKYSDMLYPSEVLFEFNGGPNNNGFNLIINKKNDGAEIHYPSPYGTYSYSKYYGNNKVEIEVAYNSGIANVIFWEFINGTYTVEYLSQIPNYEKIIEIADSGDSELALTILSGIKGIKNLLKK
jgi:hypothetical protein